MSRAKKVRFVLYSIPLLFFILVLGPASCCFEAKTAYSPPDALPIVYHEDYNIRFLGLEKLHPFDSAKYGKVHEALVNERGLDGHPFHRPAEVTPEQLRLVHTETYLDSLKNSDNVSYIAEVSAIGYLPNRPVQCQLLRPMRLATGGTILAAKLALNEGWAINLGGGYHHAKPDRGEGFCVYADIPIAARVLWQTRPELKVMVVDLDAHQGNGLEMCFSNDVRVSIYDLYNSQVYPRDEDAKAFATVDLPVPSGTAGAEYLALLERTLPDAIEQAAPDILFYNAGSDVFEGDPLGYLKLTREDIIRRDAFVFEQARDRAIPTVMLLSGGYSKESAGIISDSILNLLEPLQDSPP